MARRLASLFIVCALLLGPALCVGGLLEHHCACDEGSAVECDHDDSCPTDVCTSVVRTEDADADADTSPDFEVPTPVAIIDVWNVSSAPVGWYGPLPRPMPPDRWNLPFAQSDRPLRI